jgi:hypothetical protein
VVLRRLHHHEVRRAHPITKGESPPSATGSQRRRQTHSEPWEGANVSPGRVGLAVLGASDGTTLGACEGAVVSS